MEDSTKSAVYKLISFLLSYPEPLFFEGLPEARQWAIELGTMPETHALVRVVDKLATYTQAELEMEYVNTFDFSESRSLYITSHELGDSRNRGPALQDLRQLFMKLDLIEEAYELPDYLPALFELLAIMPEDVDSTPLRERMSAVCKTVHESLPNDSIYRLLFEVALNVLPDVVLDENNPFPLHEETDLDELPFPIFYG